MDTLRFFKESLADFKNTGSFVPSSRRLARRLTRPLAARPNMIVVELGAGTGAVTGFLAETLPIDAKIISLEINPVLVNRLRRSFKDKRIEIVEGDARDLGEHLSKLKIAKVDYIVSGLPLGNFSKNLRRAILDEIRVNLKSNGVYTQFQYFMANFIEIRKTFMMIDFVWEWRNFPPAFVYTCKLR